MDTYDSRAFFRQQRRSNNAQSECPCAEAGATTTQTTAQSRSHRGNCAVRRLDSTTEEGDRASTGVEERDYTLPERDFFVFQISTATCDDRFVFGTGEKVNRLELSGNKSTREGAGRVP